MSRSVSDNMKEAVFAQRTTEAFVILLTLEHDDLDSPIRVTPDPAETLPIAGVKGIVSNSVEFIALPFELIMPNEDEDSPPVSRVKMDNISREITLAIRSITSPPTATISVVLSSDPDTVEISIPDFTLNNVRITDLLVEGDLTTERFDYEPLPQGRFTPALFPGLF